MMGMGGMSGMGGAPGAPAKGKTEDVSYLTRTDFMIEFVWQPPKPEEQPKTKEELDTWVAEKKKAMDEAVAKSPGAELDETAFTKMSLQQSDAAFQKIVQQLDAAQKAAAPAAEGAVPPAEGAAPAAPTAPTAPAK
jgi:type IV pilus assembly protein PilM